MLISCATTPQNRGVEDFRLSVDAAPAQDFLEHVCDKPDQESFRTAWLAHEEKYWDLYWSIYYEHPDFASERPYLSRENSLRQRDYCKNARAFLMAAPGLLELLVPKAREFIGANPDLPFYFVAALQATDGKGDSYQSREVYTLNVWHETFARTTGMMATLFHELIHAAQARAFPDQSALTPFARSLYREGLAVFAVKQLFPEVGDRATGLNEEQLAVANRFLASGANDALKYLDQAQPDIYDMDRFFWGAWRDPVQPPKLGYLIGGKVFESISITRGVQKTLRMTPEEFATVVKVELQKIVEKNKSAR